MLNKGEKMYYGVNKLTFCWAKWNVNFLLIIYLLVYDLVSTVIEVLCNEHSNLEHLFEQNCSEKTMWPSASNNMNTIFTPVDYWFKACNINSQRHYQQNAANTWRITNSDIGMYDFLKSNF